MCRFKILSDSTTFSIIPGDSVEDSDSGSWDSSGPKTNSFTIVDSLIIFSIFYVYLHLCRPLRNLCRVSTLELVFPWITHEHGLDKLGSKLCFAQNIGAELCPTRCCPSRSARGLQQFARVAWSVSQAVLFRRCLRLCVVS